MIPRLLEMKTGKDLIYVCAILQAQKKSMQS